MWPERVSRRGRTVNQFDADGERARRRERHGRSSTPTRSVRASPHRQLDPPTASQPTTWCAPRTGPPPKCRVALQSPALPPCRQPCVILLEQTGGPAVLLILVDAVQLKTQESSRAREGRAVLHVTLRTAGRGAGTALLCARR
jgi:hypothetical protein